jgi:hypothetical protein
MLILMMTLFFDDVDDNQSGFFFISRYAAKFKNNNGCGNSIGWFVLLAFLAKSGIRIWS